MRRTSETAETRAHKKLKGPTEAAAQLRATRWRDVGVHMAFAFCGRWVLLDTSAAITALAILPLLPALAGLRQIPRATTQYVRATIVILVALVILASNIGGLALGMAGRVAVHSSIGLAAGYLVDAVVCASFLYVTTTRLAPGKPGSLDRYLAAVGILLALSPFIADAGNHLEAGYQQPIDLEWTCDFSPPDMTLEVISLSGTDYGPVYLSEDVPNPRVQEAALLAESEGRQQYVSIQGGEAMGTPRSDLIVRPHTYLLWRYLSTAIPSGGFTGASISNSPRFVAKAFLTLGHSLHPVPHLSGINMSCAQLKIVFHKA